jgi:hypothetical protein
MKTLSLLFLAALIAVPSIVRAEGDDDKNQLTRDEAADFKHRLVAVLDALGQPPAGYALEKDSFQLATQFNLEKDKGAYWPQSSSARRKAIAQEQQDAQTGGKSLEVEYQKKMAAAQAAGDYAAMGKLAQEMSQKATGLQSKAMASAGKDPVNVDVRLNSGGGDTIDPDNVLLESPGVIGIKIPSTETASTKESVKLFFDPVGLKDTKKVSQVNFALDKLVSSKTGVRCVEIQLDGPTEIVEAWAKKVNKAKVLSVIK